MTIPFSRIYILMLSENSLPICHHLLVQLKTSKVTVFWGIKTHITNLLRLVVGNLWCWVSTKVCLYPLALLQIRSFPCLLCPIFYMIFLFSFIKGGGQIGIICRNLIKFSHYVICALWLLNFILNTIIYHSVIPFFGGGGKRWVLLMYLYIDNGNSQENSTVLENSFHGMQ